MTKKDKQGVPIIVLGMHRSGTSLVAGLLHRIGVSMGTRLLPADQFNPGGYFEDEDFLWINKGILENAGGMWYDPPSLEKVQKSQKKFLKALKTTIASKRAYAGTRAWGWKDPRNCLTCWTFWEFVPDARYIVVIRNPDSICKSLLKAYGNKTNWKKLVDLYYKSVDDFLTSHANMSINVIYEELVNRKYAEESVVNILYLAGRKESDLPAALKTIKFR